jgi:hypothetical protein
LLSSRLPPYRPPSPFTPFLRRFTDERAHDLAVTKSLYNRVTAAHRATIWAKDDAIERVSNFVAEQVTGIVELPDFLPLGRAFDTCQHELLALETTIFSEPAVDFSKAISLKDQVDLNRHLRAQEYFLEHQDRICDLLVTAVGNVSAGIIQSLPTLEDSAFTVPLISLLPNPHDVVDRIIGTICATALVDVGLFTAVQDQIYVNMCRFSNVPLDGSSKKPLITAAEANLTPEDLVDAYLAATPFHSLLFTPVPFTLPDEQRFSGQWIIAPPGRGKTTLLHSMVIDDLQKDAAVILMDSKGDLIEPIRKLKEIADRLIIIDPDPDHPIGINPLDVPKTDIVHAVDLLEYVFSALLESKMTALQSTLFRSVLRALVTAFPNPTLETFRDILTNGYQPYIEHIKKLPQDLQDFFYKEFNSKIYEDRKKEIVWRLRLLLENDTIRSMLLAMRTRFEMGKAMDEGKVIVINNSKARLGDQGAEFFGRFFIAQLLAAAQQRAGRRTEDKRPCYFYIDECQNVIARDEKIPTILDECRSQKIALILAHQRTTQISSPNVLDALSNCAIRCTNSDDEARALAPKLRTTPEFLQSLTRGQFAVFVRDRTRHAIALKVSPIDFSEYRQLTPQETASLKQRMRDEYGVCSPATLPSTPAQPDATVEKPKTAQRPAAQDPSPAPRNDPDTGSHTDEASSW